MCAVLWRESDVSAMWDTCRETLGMLSSFLSLLSPLLCSSPGAAQMPKQHKALIIHVELYCTERVRQRACNVELVCVCNQSGDGCV